MSRNIRIKGGSTVTGELKVPGDKSISHRVAMLAAVTDGSTEIEGFASSVDCWATVECVKRLGIKVETAGGKLTIHGMGLMGLRPDPGDETNGSPVRLYVGNSGTTIRLISGLLAGQPFGTELDGDESIRRRPMRRVMEPLRLMGASVQGRLDNFAPIRIQGARLRAISYETPVASAQVKSCVLFAGLYADGKTSVREPVSSRNHSELMLQEFGAVLEIGEGGRSVTIEGGRELRPVHYQVPGDVSSAAFLVAAATVVPGSRVTIQDVNLNPSRTAFLDVLGELGASIVREHVTVRNGEAIGDLRVESRTLGGPGCVYRVPDEMIPNLIDEIPILAVVGTRMKGRLEVRNAKELRVKESDRIKSIVAALRAMGGEVEEFEDGIAITGPQTLSGARIETADDHRIAMAFSIAGLLGSGETEIVGAECAEVSFPEFYRILATLTAPGTVTQSGEPVRAEN